MKETQGAKIRTKTPWEIEGEMCTKYFFAKARKKKECKILKDQQGILAVVKTFYEQLYGRKNNVQGQIEINLIPQVIGWNDQNQSNKQINFNSKRCGTKGRNTQCFQETSNRTKLRMQSALISRVKKKISPKNRRKYNQEIIVAETEKAIKSFENNKSPGNDGLPAEFCKTFNEIRKTDLHQLYIEISQLGEMPRSMWQAVISCLYKRADREDITNWRPVSLLNYNNNNTLFILGLKSVVYRNKVLK